MSILLSVIVPVYNAESYLYENILSIIKQKKYSGNFEVLLIDDGSSDNSSEICMKLKQKYSNIKYFYQNNSGVSVARNRGLENAIGKYVCFLDSDDYVDENYVETVISIAENNDLCIFNNYIVENKKKYKEKKWLNDKFDTLIEKSCVIEWICENKINAPWDKVYLKEIIDKNNLRFKIGLNMGEDLLFNLDYAYCCNKIFLSKEAVYYHTINQDGLCHRIPSLIQFNEFDIVYKEMIDKIKNDEKEKVYRNKINQAFLRNIVNYSGKLYKNGYTKKQINEVFSGNKMIDNIKKTNPESLKDFVRKFLLKKSMYKSCSILFDK